MPFYEYQCSACRHALEVLQKITDAPLRKCPKCGRNTLRKLVSAPVFRLKGSGWYETDFKSDKDAQRNLAIEKEEKKPEKPEKAEKTETTEKVAKPEKKPVAASTRKARKPK
jgi:putative FmdB family regulatory protein